MRLALFFTWRVSLRRWDELGILERETLLYRRLGERGVEVDFVTYGDGGDLDYRGRLAGLGIRCNRWGLGRGLYRRLLPIPHLPALLGADVIKTNQMDGADAALRTARLLGKPLVARLGYMRSAKLARERGADAPEVAAARRAEDRVLRAARRIVVTTQAMAEDVERRLPGAASKTIVIPNYVDTEAFRPRGAAPDIDVLFVVRLSPEKRIERLLAAAERAGAARIAVVGSGPVEADLKARFAHMGERVIWAGTLPNAELPDWYNRARVFALPSLHEGQPKALIEAMACGAAVLGADAPGVRDMIEHDATGWLSATEPGPLADALRALFDDDALRARLGGNARRFVERNFSIDSAVDAKLAVLRDAAGGAQGASP